MVVVLSADNDGEGGILALMTLALSKASRREGKRYKTVLALGLLGAALLYADGMITPSISVLGAVEGVAVAEPAFESFVVPISIVILVSLFLAQRHGTARLGGAFGPILIVWFLTLAVLGIRSIVHQPHVLAAINPAYLVTFLANNPVEGFAVLGSVFLAVTGAEALYADMGHFGRRPIQIDWFAFVFPALTLNYLGQGALILEDPAALANPFYAMAPGWALIPLIVLATAAASIASQAVISGAFSLTRQAIQLGFLPRTLVVHTSSFEMGQVFVPLTNRVLLIATVGLVIGFGDSDSLAAAYGVAITTTMLFTTLLVFVVVRNRWGWSLPAALALVCVFLPFDIGFFAATMLKVIHGGWFPIAVAVSVFAVMTTWRLGRATLTKRFGEEMPFEMFIENITQGEHQPVRVPGVAIFMTGNPVGVPRSLGHNIRHNKVLHERVVSLTVLSLDEPYVPRDRRVEVENLGKGFYRVLARYGFMESPSVPEILDQCESKGLKITLFSTTFFIGRENIVITQRRAMARWRLNLFNFLARNAQSPTDFFGIPPNQVVELGLQVEL
jgi:KUP system potassium uptake protein